PHEQTNQDIVDILCEHEANRKHYAERNQRLDQPGPQLNQVIEQWRLSRLDIFVRHVPPPACFGGGASATAKSFSLTGDGGSGRGTFTSDCCAGSGKADGVAGADSVDTSAAFPGSGISKARSISFCVFTIGSKLVRSLTEVLRSSACFLKSAISASRMASWNWPWNSAAMRRILPMYWPSVRNTVGSSFGPIAISATMPMTTSSPQPMSNMD